jgi:hypothetical protein
MQPRLARKQLLEHNKEVGTSITTRQDMNFDQWLCFDGQRQVENRHPEASSKICWLIIPSLYDVAMHVHSSLESRESRQSPERERVSRGRKYPVLLTYVRTGRYPTYETSEEPKRNSRSTSPSHSHSNERNQKQRLLSSLSLLPLDHIR